MDKQFAYSTLEIKAMDDGSGRRMFKGIATTPTADRTGDIVEPKGAEFELPLPLCWMHDSADPIGWVTSAKVTAKGIEIEGEVANISEPESLKERLDTAWAMLKGKLVRGLSIGFKPLEAARIAETYSYRYTKWLWLELSPVVIAANGDCSITQIKSVDQAVRRATHGASGAQLGRLTAGPSGFPDESGTQAPATRGASHSRTKGKNMKTLQQLMEERATKSARMTELIELRSTETRSFDENESTEFKALDSEVASLDEEISIKRFEERQAAAATRVKGANSEDGSGSRGGMSFVRKQDPDDKFAGQSFTRVLIAKALAMSTGESAIGIAQKRWGDTNPRLVQLVKATVAGGGTGSGEWGAELAQSDARFTGDFVEYLYGKTIFDQLNLRSVPARVHVKGQDGAFTGYWVGESKAIPASRGDYSDVELTPLKVAGLAVISMELLEDSQPSAEMLVRDGLVEASSQRVDTTFLSANAASAGVSPAGILNGVSGIAPSGADLAAIRADLQTLLYPFVTGKMASGITLVMNPATAMALGMMYGTLDQLAFPDINENGGTLNKRPVIVGDNVTPGNIIAIRTQDVWRIGDSGIRVSMSREATIEQRDDPTGATDTPTGVTTAGLTNMFQEESVAFKVVRRINFQKRRAAAVQYIQDAEYGGVVS